MCQYFQTLTRVILTMPCAQVVAPSDRQSICGSETKGLNHSQPDLPDCRCSSLRPPMSA